MEYLGKATDKSIRKTVDNWYFLFYTASDVAKPDVALLTIEETLYYEETLEDCWIIVCKSRVMDNGELGYNKITVESSEQDVEGKKVLKKGKPVADSEKRDTENVPLNQDINDYLAREVPTHGQTMPRPRCSERFLSPARSMSTKNRRRLPISPPVLRSTRRISWRNCTPFFGKEK